MMPADIEVAERQSTQILFFRFSHKFDDDDDTFDACVAQFVCHVFSIPRQTYGKQHFFFDFAVLGMAWMSRRWSSLSGQKSYESISMYSSADVDKSLFFAWRNASQQRLSVQTMSILEMRWQKISLFMRFAVIERHESRINTKQENRKNRVVPSLAIRPIRVRKTN